jgi:hypothetical protein
MGRETGRERGLLPLEFVASEAETDTTSPCDLRLETDDSSRLLAKPENI